MCKVKSNSNEANADKRMVDPNNNNENKETKTLSQRLREAPYSNRLVGQSFVVSIPTKLKENNK